MPVLAMDYCFLAVDEKDSKTATTLVILRDELSSYTGAAVVPEKRPSPYVIAFLDKYFDEVGYTRSFCRVTGSLPSSRWRRPWCEHEAAKTRTS